MLDAVLGYAQRGWPVLPLWPGKKTPRGTLVPNGHKDATTDEATIKQWWGRYPSANVGIRVGPESGLFVLDVDNKGGKDGSAELATVERKYGLMPATYTVKTASGGLHYYFNFPDELRGKDLKKAIAGGLDLKYNGYVVAPPSTVEGAAYAVVNGSLSVLAEWPAALLE